MDLFSQMKIFRKVAQVKSFTHAANELGISLSAVSREIERLEEHTAQQLIIRTTRKMSLTEAGSEYYERISRLLDEADDIQRCMVDKWAEPQGRIRIAVNIIIGSTVLTPLIPKFLNQYPKMTLDIDYTDRLVDLVGEGFDLAITVGPLRDSSLRTAKLGAITEVLCASASYLEKYGAPENVSELEAHPLLVFTENGVPAPWYIKSNGKIKMKHFKGVVELNHALSYLELLRAGSGIGLIHDWFIKDDLLSGRLKRLLPNEWIRYYPTEQTEVSVVYPESHYQSQRVRLLIDFLKSEINFTEG